MNCGFEDVDVLFQLLSQNPEQAKWLDAFQHSRKPNADAIANLALYNYIEMRDLSGKAGFQLRTKIEKRIAQHFPGRFMTLYSMVTFSELPYATALSKGKEQGELLDKIMHLHDIENNWESEAVLKMAEDWLKEKEL